MTEYNKLVRDGIPDKLDNQGLKYTYHIASVKEYWRALLDKLLEEVLEFQKDRNIEELADIREVLNAIYAVMGFTEDKIRAVVSSELSYTRNLTLELIDQISIFQLNLKIEGLMYINKVLDDIYKEIGVTVEMVEDARLKKKEERGGFNKRIILERVEDSDK